MICLGAKTDQEVKENETCGSHFKKKKKKTKQKETDRDETVREREREREFDLLLLYFFSSLASLFDIWKSDRRNSSMQ